MSNFFSTVYTIPVYNASCLETSNVSSSTAPFLIQVSCSSKEDVLNTKLRMFQVLATDTVLRENVDELADAVINLVQKNVSCYLAPKNATMEQVQVNNLLVNYGRWACLHYKTRDTFYIFYDRAELLKLLFIHCESPAYCKLIDNVSIRSARHPDASSVGEYWSVNTEMQNRTKLIERQLNGYNLPGNAAAASSSSAGDTTYPLLENISEQPLSTSEFIHCLAFLLLEDVIEDRLAEIYLELQPKAKSNKLHFGAKHLVGPISVRVNHDAATTTGEATVHR